MFFQILSTPMSDNVKNYKGVYRSKPIPRDGVNERFMELWCRYNDTKCVSGVTDELTLCELKELAALSSVFWKEDFEVVYVSEKPACPYPSKYYGIDVAGIGGYSMVGENIFIDSAKLPQNIYGLYDILNAFFRPKMNKYGLFSKKEDAESLITVFEDFRQLSENSIENEDWRVLHVFAIK